MKLRLEQKIVRDLPLIEARYKIGKITKTEFKHTLEKKLTMLRDGVKNTEDNFTDSTKELLWCKLENL